MAKKIRKESLQLNSLQVSRVHFAMVAAFIVSTIAADAWNLIPPGSVLQRWTLISIVTMINAVIWYGARNQTRSEFYYKALIYTQIIVDIVMVSLLVYSQRGVDSLAVALYAVPIITASTLLLPSALYATATLSASAYAITAIRYQFLHPGEAYKIELYAELFFYGAVFFVMAALLSIMIRSKK
jgi:hypothetical protein